MDNPATPDVDLDDLNDPDDLKPPPPAPDGHNEDADEDLSELDDGEDNDLDLDDEDGVLDADPATTPAES